MSILIKGLKKPKTCARFEDGEFTFCPFVNTDDDCILQDKVTNTWEEMYQNCPLIELPEKHGRLIDADALHVLFENQWHYLQCLNWDENPKAEEKQTGINWCINTLHDDAKTIIEAEGDEE